MIGVYRFKNNYILIIIINTKTKMNTDLIIAIAVINHESINDVMLWTFRPDRYVMLL